jgi:hypothetical protein
VALERLEAVAFDLIAMNLAEVVPEHIVVVVVDGRCPTGPQQSVGHCSRASHLFNFRAGAAEGGPEC